MHWLTVVLSGALIWVVAFDLIGSLGARRYGFPYKNLAIASFLAYALAGAIAAIHGSLLSAVLVGTAMGFADGTVGWAISWHIGPGRAAALTTSRIIGVVLSVIAIAALLACIGGLFASYLLAQPQVHFHG